MKTKYLYRFKTEEEFIKEFGSNWKLKVNQEWGIHGHMDYLFGTDFKFIVDDNFSIKHNYHSKWIISKDMITKKVIVPNYLPRKIIKEI